MKTDRLLELAGLLTESKTKLNENMNMTVEDILYKYSESLMKLIIKREPLNTFVNSYNVDRMSGTFSMDLKNPKDQNGDSYLVHATPFWEGEFEIPVACDNSNGETVYNNTISWPHPTFDVNADFEFYVKKLKIELMKIISEIEKIKNN